MAKIILVKWLSDDGQVAVSFPRQLSQSPTAIVRHANVAARHATIILTMHWNKTIGCSIPQKPNQTRQDHRAYYANRQRRFYNAALRRFTTLFKSMGLK